MTGTSAVTIIVLAFGSEPWLGECLSALATTDADVVLVDNGSAHPDLVDAWAAEPKVTVIRPAENLGYAGGCNAGAHAASGDVLVFVNSDAVVQPGAIAALVTAVQDRSAGLVCGSIRLADDPTRLNTAGNPFHYTGLVWAGHFGEAADEHAEAVDVATITGATFAVRRDTWQRLGGFPEEWFAYHEDSYLSLRAWQCGLRVRYEPAAVVHHHYQFSRNPLKSYLLERNRLLNLLTLYERRTWLVLFPALLFFELLMLAVSVREGWFGQKVSGYAWILRHRDVVRSHRRRAQRERRHPDRELAPMWASRLVFENVAAPRGLTVVNVVLDAYWRLARRVL